MSAIKSSTTSIFRFEAGKFVVLLLIIVSFIALFASCRKKRNENIPDLRLYITVKDKNYFNVDDVDQEERLPENLPFRKYLPSLCYTLTDLVTGKVIYDSGVFEVTGDSSVVPVEVDDRVLPFGTYLLTVWGGLDDDRPLGDDFHSIDFHLRNTEGNDIYLTNDTIVYDAANTFHLVEMERMKGKLIIKVENLPDGYETSQKRVTNVSGQADADFNYSGSTMVKTEVSWTGNSVLTKTVLTPTVDDNVSVVRIQFINEESGTPLISPEDVKIQILRNELSVVKYIWDDDTQNFDIQIRVNDSWQKYHGLVID